MSKIQFRALTALFVIGASMVVAGCEGETKPAPAAGAPAAAPAAPGKEAPADKAK